MKQDMTIAAVQDLIYKTSTGIMILLNQLEEQTGCTVERVELNRVNMLSGKTQVVDVNLDVRV